MVNRRAEARMQTLYHARVYDVQTDELVGYLVEVSRHGVRLMAPRPLDPRANLVLQFHCPEAGDGPRTTTFKAQVQWCRRDPNLDFWAAGLYVMENAEELFTLFLALEEHLCTKS